MSFQRILDHSNFLVCLTKTNKKHLSKFLNKSTDSELESIVELIYNSTKIDLSDSEKSCIKSCKTLCKYFENNDKLTRSKVLVQLKKRPLQLKRLVACMFSKFFSEGLLVGIDN